MINEAIKQLTLWQKQGIDLEISINISAHHIQSNNFFEQFNATLSCNPLINSNNLQIEILETSALRDIDAIRDIILRCQKVLGLKVALDDFGTGYSSLTHLRSLPANTIKIDRSFVRDLLDDPNDFSIIDGIISLAEAFDRDIIAEGVETTEHGLMLLMMGCYDAQGYGIAKPMAPEDFALWLQQYQPNQAWIDYATTDYTEQQRKIIQIELTMAYWFENLSERLRDGDSTLKDNFTPCPLRYWLKRFEKEALFDVEWFALLQNAHHALYQQAESLALQMNSAISEQKLHDLNLQYQSLMALLTDYQVKKN